MADLLVTVSEGDTRFDPQHLVEVSLQRWPTADWYAPDPEPEDELAAMLARQVTIQDDQRVLIVDFVVTDWTDDVVTLRPNMTRDEVHALRD